MRAAQIKSDADARAAQAKSDSDARAAQAQATTENNKFLLGLMTRGGGGEEKLANLLALMKPYLQPPRAAQERDVLGILREARELFPQAGARGGERDQTDCGHVRGHHDAVPWRQMPRRRRLRPNCGRPRFQAARGPEVPSQRRDREPPPLVHVLGLGLVHVVAPEATLTYAPGDRGSHGPGSRGSHGQALAAPAAQAPAAPAAQAPAAPAVSGSRCSRG